MRYDEAFTFLEYGTSYMGYISMNYSYPNNHILHSLLVRISTIILGDELWLIRLPAFVGGIFTLIFTFLLGRKWFGLKAGIIAITLVVFSEMLIGYTVNARGYSLQTSLFLCVLFLMIENHNKIGRWIIIAILNAIGFWLIPSYIFCLGIILFLFIIKHGFKKQLIPMLGLSFFLGSLLYLPVIGYLGTDALLNNPLVQIYDPLNYVHDFSENVKSIFTQLTPTLGLTKLAVFCLFLLTSFQKKTKFLSIGIVLTLGLMIVVMGKQVPPRVFVFLLPLSALLFSNSIIKYTDHLKIKYFLPLLIIPILSWSYYKNKKFDYEEGLSDIPELVKDLKSENRVGVISKIPVDYSVRYYLSQNSELKSSWNSFGADTVYVIVNEFYQQELSKTFGKKSKGYQFTKIKKYNYSTVYMGLKD
jgi:hypothetical protein